MCRQHIPLQQISWLACPERDSSRYRWLRAKLRADDDPAVAAVLNISFLMIGDDIRGFTELIVKLLLGQISRDHPEFHLPILDIYQRIAYNILHELDVIQGLDETPVIRGLRNMLAPLTLRVLERARELLIEEQDDFDMMREFS
jgi:hypothetical protein